VPVREEAADLQLAEDILANRKSEDLSRTTTRKADADAAQLPIIRMLGRVCGGTRRMARQGHILDNHQVGHAGCFAAAAHEATNDRRVDPTVGPGW
jgi:hypothetical protein